MRHIQTKALQILSFADAKDLSRKRFTVTSSAEHSFRNVDGYCFKGN